MTERTIRSHAKALAGAFYDGTRSGKFRAGMDVPVKVLKTDPATGKTVEVVVKRPFHEAFPNVHSYIKGHWPLFYDLARRQLTQMLAMPGVHKNVKDAIFKAIIEDREKQDALQRKNVDIPDLIGQRGSLENDEQLR